MNRKAVRKSTSDAGYKKKGKKEEKNAQYFRSKGNCAVFAVAKNNLKIRSDLFTVRKTSCFQERMILHLSVHE